MSAAQHGIDLGRGLRLPNPVGLASGTAGYGFELSQLMDIRRVGTLYTKGTTRLPRAGNAPPRVTEVACGMLNSIGLQNPGVDVVAGEYAPRFARWGIPVVVNIAGADADDYVHCVRRLEAVDGIAGVELNISCPNIAHGLDFGRDAAAAAALTERVRAVTDTHVMVKLSPNVTDIAAIAAAVESAGADSISAVNTYVGMKIDRDTGRPVLAQGTGGLSGPAIHAQALAAVAAVRGSVHIPVVGVGGIDGAEAARDFFAVGARAVQVGTANFVEPGIAIRIIDELTVRREAVRLVLMDEADRVLLLHYVTVDTNEDFWCTPGGALQPGESDEQAAFRELSEETGMSPPALGPMLWERDHVFHVGDGRTFEQHERFYMQRVGEFQPAGAGLSAFEQRSIVGYRWWSLDELRHTECVIQPLDLARRLAGQLVAPER